MSRSMILAPMNLASMSSLYILGKTMNTIKVYVIMQQMVLHRLSHWKPREIKAM